MNTTEPHYPYILYPKKLQQALEQRSIPQKPNYNQIYQAVCRANPFTIPCPIQPDEPKYFSILQPISRQDKAHPEKPDPKKFSQCWFFIILALSALFAAIFWHTNLKSYVVIWLIVPIIYFYGGQYWLKRYNERKSNEYQKECQKIDSFNKQQRQTVIQQNQRINEDNKPKQQKNQELKQKYQRDLDNFQRRFKQWEQEKQEHKRKIKKIAQQQFETQIQQYNLQCEQAEKRRIREAFKTIKLVPCGFSKLPEHQEKKHKRGFAEKKALEVFKKLEQYFKGKIYELRGLFFYNNRTIVTSLKYPNFQTKSKKKKFFYVPDYAYVEKIEDDKFICIDIEIDESYTFDDETKENQPIHYIENKEEQKRDKIFTDNGWFVIRFSEGQIFENPLSCCKEIVKLICNVTGRDMPQALLLINDLEPEKRWTEAETRQKMLNNEKAG